MCSPLGRLVSEILYRNFGEFVKTVGFDLFNCGAKSIGLIVKSTKLKRAQVIECLRALVKYDLVAFEPSPNESVADYKLNINNLLLILRYPSYLLLVKNKFGTEAELIIEEILQNGMVSLSEIIYSIGKKYREDKDKNVYVTSLREIFLSLATAGYVRKVPNVADLSRDVPTFEVDVDAATVPDVQASVDVRALTLAISGDEKLDVVDNVYWKVNFDRFHQDIRDEFMIKAITRRIDENAGELMRHMLQQLYLSSEPWTSVSSPIASVDIKRSCKRADKDFPLLTQYIDQYLKVIEDNSEGLVHRKGDASGGHYFVDMKSAARRLAMDAIDHLVQEKLGSTAARIFRLIRTHKFIEEANIQKNAMLPAKEAKRLTYKLMEENFISVQPLRKAVTGGMGPTKAIYLYYVDIHKVACMVREMCYLALANCACRSRLERAARERLLLKQQRVNTIVHGMRLRGDPIENINDIEETVTPPEREILAAVGKMFKKLDIAEIELDKMLFILQWYFVHTS